MPSKVGDCHPNHPSLFACARRSRPRGSQSSQVLHYLMNLLQSVRPVGWLAGPSASLRIPLCPSQTLQTWATRRGSKPAVRHRLCQRAASRTRPLLSSIDRWALLIMRSRCIRLLMRTFELVCPRMAMMASVSFKPFVATGCQHCQVLGWIPGRTSLMSRASA